MSDPAGWNAGIVEEFRAHEGHVGGPFENVPLVLVHHVGRRSGREFVSPVAYLADETDPGTVYIFASKGGAPTNPDWYHNLVAAGHATVERGTQSYAVTVTEVTGPERDAIYARQVERVPGFGGYAERTAGVRTIPVLRLTRAD
jgi:deazaflavin-dependent oxidoreductase (nitroreductase family)